jgi:hypothetical protein
VPKFPVDESGEVIARFAGDETAERHLGGIEFLLTPIRQ